MRSTGKLNQCVLAYTYDRSGIKGAPFDPILREWPEGYEVSVIKRNVLVHGVRCHLVSMVKPQFRHVTEHFIGKSESVYIPDLAITWDKDYAKLMPCDVPKRALPMMLGDIGAEVYRDPNEVRIRKVDIEEVIRSAYAKEWKP